VITVPLLIGLDGKQKMSKSLGNYIGITEPPDSMFGKLMSIPDSLIVHYFDLLTEKTQEEIKKIKHALSRGEVNPKDLKIDLAKQIVTKLHSKSAANQAAREFERVFARGAMPTKMPEINIQPKVLSLLELVIATKAVSSKSEARRVITQGGVKLNNVVKSDPFEKIEVKEGMVLKVGKLKFFRIKHK